MASSHDFKQSASLVDRLREILHDYPDSSILKEMLQNADDAGATVMKIGFDRRSYQEGGVPERFNPTGMQGPALLVYNNGTFSDKDISSIQSIGRSGKRDNLQKTGRFGIGFNSVYHVSDTPSFVSGSRVCFFDPLCEHLPGRNAGYKMDLSDAADAAQVQAHPSLMQPYSRFGCRAVDGQHFEGTLFRLPLRTPGQAVRDDYLRKVPFLEEDVEKLLSGFCSEAGCMPLFLKNVRTLEVHYFGEHSTEDEQRTFIADLPGLSADSAASRAFHTRLPVPATVEGLMQVSMRVDLEVVTGGVAKGWRVRQSAGGGLACRMSCDGAAADYGIKLLPWGGVAAPMSGAVVAGEGGGEGDGDGDSAGLGRAFCFLPMPVATGLPVHINGYFELPSDRRGIFWGVGDTGEAELRSAWNEALLKDVIAQEYTVLLRDVQEAVCGTPERACELYDLMPARDIDMPWRLVSEEVCKRLADIPCLWCGPSGGWRRPDGCWVATAGAVPHAVLAGLRSLGFVVAEVPARVAQCLGDEARPLTAAAVCAGAAQNPGRAHPGGRLAAAEACAVLDWALSELAVLNGHNIPAPTSPLAVSLRQLPLAAVLSGSTVPFAGSDLLHCSSSTAAATSTPTRVEQLVCGTPAGGRILSTAAVAGCPSLQEKLQLPQWRSVLGVRLATRSSVMSLLPLAGLPQGCAPAAGNRNGKDNSTMNLQTHVAWSQQLWACLDELADGEGGSGWADPGVGWCVVPCGGGAYTCRLQRQTADTVRVMGASSSTADATAVPGELDTVLREAGVHAADVPHLEGYIQQRTALGCFRALHAARATPLPAASAGVVRAWLAHTLHALPQAELRSRAVQLPVWLVWGGAGPAPLPAGHCVLPSAIRDTPVEQLLRHHARASPEEAEVLVRAGVPRLSDAEFWVSFLQYAACTPGAGGGSERAAFVSAAEQALCAAVQHPEVRQAACDATVVPTAAGVLRPLCSGLCDPNTPETAALLPDIHIVEDGFATGKARNALLLLGMRTTLSTDDVVGLCCTLAGEGDVSRATAMLHYMDRNLQSLQTDVLFQKLQGVAWVPVTKELPDALLPVQGGVAAPLRVAADVRPQDQMWLCSASKGIAARPCSARLSRCFGWDAPLPAAVLVAQLLAVSAKHAESAADTAAGVAVNSRVLELYGALEAHRQAGSLGAALQGLEQRPCVWVGTQFAPPQQVAQETTYGLPGLHTLPATLQQFATLLHAMGVELHFTPNTYADALGTLAHKSAAASLSDPVLQQVVALLVRLEHDAAHLRSPVLLPSMAGVLCPCNALLYDDMQGVECGVEGLVPLHPMVPRKVAETFGVPMKRMLVACSGEDDWGFEEGIEAYGQSESLTSRIRNILSEYVSDVGIFNEMLQNADDAQASQFTVMLDMTEYGTSSLMNSALEPLQGPAIVVHNDAQFTNADFSNLASVGKGAKLESTSKTGRFGIGFNAVYHFTDVPSILSGGSLVFLDPHRRHVRGSTEGAPGIKLSVPWSKASLFADQLAPYRQAGTDMVSDPQQVYDGTLFRFPLRTEEAAARSDLSKQTYSVQQAEELLQKFCGTASELLLFLKHVRCVRVLVRNGDSVDEVYHTELSVDPAHEERHKQVYTFVAGTSESSASRDGLKHRLNTTQDADLPWEVTDVAIATRARGEDGTTTETRTGWVLSAGIGGGETKELAVKAAEGRKLLPWGGVALQRGRAAGAPATGRAYAFLPLPQSSGMAWHINGAFDLSTNRRNLWFDDFGEHGERSLWNVALMQDPCVPAAVRLLLRLAEEAGSAAAAQLYELLPGAGLHGLFEQFADALYLRLQSVPVLASMNADGSVGAWVAPSKAVLLDMQEGDTHYARRAVIAKALVLAGKVVASVPPHVSAMLLKHGAVAVTPECLRETLKALPSLPSGLKPADVAQLLACAASDLGTAGKGFEHLHGVPLLPVVSGDVKRFCAGTDPAELVFSGVPGGFLKGLPAVKGIVAVDSLLRDSAVPLAALMASTNLRKVAEPKHLHLLLSSALDPSMFDTARVSRSDPKAPKKEVVDAFWEILHRIRGKMEGDLSRWPLIPATSVFVDKANRHTVLWGVPQDLVPVLVELGIDSVTNTSNYILELVPRSSCETILDALLAVHKTTSDSVSVVSKMQPEARHKLLQCLVTSTRCSHVHNVPKIADHHRELLKALPIYRLHPAESGRFSHIDPAVQLPPVGSLKYSPAVLAGHYDAPNDKTRKFMEAVGATTVSHEDFMTRLLSNRPPGADDYNVARVVVGYFASGGAPEAGSRAANLLRNTAWVPNRAGGFKRPAQLLSPELAGVGSVPDCVLPRTDIPHVTLAKVGVHTEVTWQAAVVWAEGVSTISCRKEAHKFAAYLQHGVRALDPTKTGFSAFSAIPCVPVQQINEAGYPHDPALVPDNGLMSPEQVQRASNRALCSAVCGIVVDEVCRVEVGFANYGGFAAVGGYPDYLPLWLVKQVVPNTVLVQQLLKAVALGPDEVVTPHIYSEISRRLGRAEAHTTRYPYSCDPELTEALRMRHAFNAVLGNDIVRIGTSFKRPLEVALSPPAVQGAPYLCQMPEDELAKWRAEWAPLLSALGIVESFGPANYAACVARLAEERNGEALEAGVLEKVVEIAKHVAESESPRSLSHLPNTSGVLRGVNQLVYNDMDGDDTTHELVHASIPNEVAERLGAESCKERVYREIQQRVTCPQKAQLVPRLKGHGVESIVHELLGVAHQLGAAHVGFTLDTAQHGSAFVIPNTEQHQGPGVLFCLRGVQVSCDEVERLVSGEAAPGGGLGLAACFTASDCVQVAASGQLMIFQPGAPLSPSLPLVDVRKKFAPHLSAFRGDEEVGLAVRFGLRTQASGLGRACSPADFGEVLRRVSRVVPSMLPLRPSVQQVVFGEQGPAVAQAEVPAGAGLDEQPAAADADTLRPVSRCVVRFPSEEAGKDPRAAAWCRQQLRHTGLAAFVAPATEKTSVYTVEVDRFEPRCDDNTDGDGDGGGGGETCTTQRWAAVLTAGAIPTQLHGVELDPVGGAAALLGVDGQQAATSALCAAGRQLTLCPQLHSTPTGLPVQLLCAEVGSEVAAPQMEAWNAAVRRTMHTAYGVLLRELCARSNTLALPTQQTCYSFWPDDSQARDTHMQCVEHVYRQLSAHPLFLLCTAGAAAYEPATKASFAYVQGLSTELEEGALLAVSQELPVFSVPQHVARGMCLHSGSEGVSALSAADVCDAFRMNSDTVDSLVSRLDTPQQVVSLLEIAADALQPHEAGRLRQVRLLPMYEGAGILTVAAFASQTVWIGGQAECTLFPHKLGQFAHPCLMDSETLRPLLLDAKVQDALRLHKPAAREVLQLLQGAQQATPVPRSWKGQSAVPAEAAAAVPHEWLQSLWCIMQPNDTARFTSWPLLPLADGRLVSCGDVQLVFNFEAEEVSVGAAAEGGTGAVDTHTPVPSHSAHDPAVLREHVCALGLPVASPVFTGVTRFQPQGTAAQVVAQKLADCTQRGLVQWEGACVAHTDALLQYLAGSSSDFGEQVHADNIRKLPLFTPVSDPGSRVALQQTDCTAAPAVPFLQDVKWVTRSDETDPLLQQLGVELLSEADVWVREVIPSLHDNMRSDERHDKLLYLRDNYARLLGVVDVGGAEGDEGPEGAVVDVEGAAGDEDTDAPAVAESSESSDANEPHLASDLRELETDMMNAAIV